MAICKFIVVLAMPAAASDVGLAKAMAAAQSGDVATAQAAIRNADSPLVKKLISWELLQQSNVLAPFEDYTSFLSYAKGWPLLSAIQLRAESVLPESLPDAEVVAWFSTRGPITSRGMIRYVNALNNSGDAPGAKKALRDYFTTRDFGTESATAIITALPGMVTVDDIAARVDKLIWEEKFTAANDLLAYLPDDARRLPATRIALLQNTMNADQYLGALSDAEKNDPGVAFARARWRRELGFDSSAAVILSRCTAPASREEDVAKERGILARRFFESNDMGGAYAVAAAQPVTIGQNATQNIWYAGWVALRFKQDTSAAAQHFQAFYDHVQTPVSKARGAYWLARTAETAGQSSVANQWYQQAAQYGTTFYGQLAADKLGQSISLPPRMADSMQSPILKDDRVQAAKLLSRANDPVNARLFFRAALNDATSENEFAALANWSNQNNQPQWAVLASKGAQQKGFMGLRAGYPVLAKDIREEFDPRIDPALAHALIRQESEFDVNAKSVSGALGLMQLLPTTAKYVANKMRIGHEKAALTSNPAHNVALGSRYIADQLSNFDNAYLAIAAYNAGPGRVKQWLGSIGDPRQENIDPIDWIESIPVYETRNYVQRVTENQNVYAALLSNRQVDEQTSGQEQTVARQ